MKKAPEELPDEKLLYLSTVLLEEYRIIHGQEKGDVLEKRLESLDLSTESSADLTDQQKKEKENARLKLVHEAVHSLRDKQTALCLSGGGIRSATFCLGILQGLTHFNLLDKFDYLSTVSGGGYIGSWLTAWLTNEGPNNVLKELRTNAEQDFKSESRSIFEPEPREIAHLRAFSNYLSPKMGLLSADTWSLVAIYLRNLVLNWLVLIPLLISALLIPRIYVSLIKPDTGIQLFDRLILANKNYLPDIGQVLLYIGMFLGSMALAYIGSHRPSLRNVGGENKDEKPDESKDADTPKSLLGSHLGVKSDIEEEDQDDTKRFKRFFIIPLLLSVFLLTIGRAWFLHNHENYWTLVNFMSFGAALLVLGYILTFVEVAVFFGQKVFLNFINRKNGNLRIRGLELITVFVTGLIGGVLLWLLSIPEKLNGWFPDEHATLYAYLDGPQLMFVFLLMGIISIGVGSRHISDEDREWWARAGAWVLIIIVIWFVIAVLVLKGPELLSYPSPSTIKIVTTVLGVIAAIFTIVSAISSKTPANNRQAEKYGRLTVLFNFSVKFFAPFSALFLVIILSFFTSWLIVLIKYAPKVYRCPAHVEQTYLANVGDECSDTVVQTAGGQLISAWPPFPRVDHEKVLYDSSFLFLIVLGGVMFLISYAMAWFINVNQFSLHAMYRNRLVRAYLGASNPARKPNLFTGFDPNDNKRMSEVWPVKYKGKDPDKDKKQRHRLFHIVNITWNLVHGKNLAWQNRKATTFTVSPLHAGNYLHGYRRAEVYGEEKRFGSISLGTALTISGAAASPNMGYYPSTAVAFLMTLFNARLGWWLGNPTKGTYKDPGPTFALRPMIDEALGRTEDRQKYIYLSDGGHFENLGLYEMVLRRSQCIVVVDASRDPDRKFENLGNAIRRIRVDLGVDIRIRDIVNYSKKENEPITYCAIGDILYNDIDKSENGFLIYIKPALIGEVPTDVFNYAKDNLEFPHESIRDQWFSEQQFESYRTLGFYAIEQIFDGWQKEQDFAPAELKRYIEHYIQKAHGSGKKPDSPEPEKPVGV